ncbi:uncharacterized protein LOC124669272 [Lolium rigidum]|uniref:uncharacterized protein LOC124669272 n=1 Tax=Lolium rigidum TaxID=89674 RepID=UPI001F5D73D0|nr:uncharacterized protein LOC124669272 [Lolium rigidum]
MPEEMMCCGTASFKDVDRCELIGRGETPRKEEKPVHVAKEKKKPSGGKKENPYASLGLDKFSTVLAELESRREKVLRRVEGGGDHVMVRFVQSGAKGWVPIVVKLPPEEPAAKGKPKKKCKLKSAVSPPLSQPSTPRSSTESSSPRGEVVFEHAAAVETTPAVVASAVPKKVAPVRRWSWGKRAIRPSQYWPLAAVLLLVSLVVFGRASAICCTTVLWYLVPILTGGEEGLGAKIGKDPAKKATDKKIGGKLTWSSLPPSHGKKNSSGANEVISPRSHAHGKKG